VLHRVVPSQYTSFEDISLENLQTVFSQASSQYLTISDNLDNLDNEYYYIVTFDDGYLSDYELVFPLIKNLNIVATFFINPINVGKPGFMNWDMIREMSIAGMLFGSHGLSHQNMVSLSLNEAKDELLKSRETIEKNIGKVISSFSFPFGQYNNKLIELAGRCGYSNCFVSSHGIMSYKKNFIPRNSINSKMKKSDIFNILFVTNKGILKWMIEDFVKITLKKLLGVNYYKKIRDWFFSKKSYEL